MGTIDSEGIDQRRAQIRDISVQLGDANLYLQGARSRLDEAAGLLAVVDYVLRADASHNETAEALSDVFEQIELCTGRAIEQVQEISRRLPSDRDLRQTFS
jgi:hypothetical protein